MIQMGLEEFFEKLSKTPRDWYLTDSYSDGFKVIRRGDADANTYQCPIAAVFNWNTVSPDPRFVDRGHDLINAADGIDADSKLRERMLKACGFSHTEPY